jgi:hypothetical protein
MPELYTFPGCPKLIPRRPARSAEIRAQWGYFPVSDARGSRAASTPGRLISASTT